MYYQVVPEQHLKLDSITDIVPGMLLNGPEFRQGQTVVTTQSTDTSYN
jgi:hypothetical protein